MKKSYSTLCSITRKSALALGTLTLVLGTMTSCSENDLVTPSENEVANSIETSPLSLTNDASYLSKFVTNYKKARSRGENVPVSHFTLAAPAAADVAAAQPILYNIGGTTYAIVAPGWGLSPNTAYCIPKGAVYNAANEIRFIQPQVNDKVGTFQWDNEAGKSVPVPGTTPNVLYSKYGFAPWAQMTGAQLVEIIEAEGWDAIKECINLGDYALDDSAKALNLPAGSKLYIEGTLYGRPNNTNEAEIYILPGSDVTLTMDLLEANHTVYAYTNFALTTKALTINGKIYVGEDANFYYPTVDVAINGGTLCCSNDVHVKNFRNNTTGARTQAKCLIAEEKADLKNVGAIVIEDYLTAKEEINFEGTSQITMNAGSLVYSPIIRFTGQYGSANNQIASVGDIYTVVACGDLYFGFSGGDHDGDLSQALVGNIYLEVQNLYAMKDGGNMATTFDKIVFDESVRHGSNLDHTPLITEDLDGCRGTYGKKPQTAGVDPGNDDDPETPGTPDTPDTPDVPDTPSDPVLDVISKIEMDHSHPISATCIDLKGNQAFISWHERGANMQGCIEVLNVDPSTNTVEFQAWMETPRATSASVNGSTAYDFNHLIYDARTNSLLTVGDHFKKGGFVAQIKLNDVFSTGAAVGENLNLLIPRQIPFAASGNAVLRYGEDLYIAGAGGYSIFPFGNGEKFPISNTKKTDYTLKSECDSLATAGSAKHVALYGSTLATIEYTDRGAAEQLPAKITLWNAADWLKSSAIISSWTVPNFGPTYGKDVIALDDNYVYSCQGQNGMAIYDHSGNEVARFNVNNYLNKENGFTDAERNKMRNSAANGLCVYGDYVFVAYGGAGVWVLSKAKDFAPVAHFTDAGSYFSQEMGTEIGASANFVKVTSDGYVYVAYGLGGMMVLKFDAANIR